jgi:hypothetical protein
MGFFMVISWRFNQQKPGMLVDIPGLVVTKNELERSTMEING